jgi:hypothetical protein
MQLLLLAFVAAFYPTLLAAVVILLAQPHPARLIGAYLGAGLTISIAIGLVIVFSLEGVVEDESSTTSTSTDLAVGGLALLAALALSTHTDVRLREARRRRHEHNGRHRAVNEPEPDAEKKEPWAQRIMARGSVPVVIVAGFVMNLPGATYLVALKDIAAGQYATVTAVGLILLFNVIMFLLAEIPFVGLMVAPERTGALVERFNDWLSTHGRQVATLLCAVLGGFLVWRGIAHS